jgi:hypothetical protein
MKKNEKPLLGIFIWFVFGVIFSWIVYDIYQEQKNKSIKNELSKPVVCDTIYDNVTIDTTIGYFNDTTKSWPIKVTSVVRNTDKFIDGKWQVMTENGVMYYTNSTTYVGQIAFYINDNDEIVDKYGKNELDPREWR